MNDVGLIILAPRRGNGPCARCQIDLVPGHLRNFLAALSDQGKKLYDATVRRPDLAGGFDDGA